MKPVTKQKTDYRKSSTRHGDWFTRTWTGLKGDHAMFNSENQPKEYHMFVCMWQNKIVGDVYIIFPTIVSDGE